MRIEILTIVLAAVVGSSVQADERRVLRVEAPLTHASWEPRVLADGCVLTHEVPGYGHARFVADAEGRLSFELDPWWRPRRGDTLTVASAPPAWRHDGVSREVAVVRVESNHEVVSASHEIAERFLIELKQGMELRIRHQDWVDAQDSVDVRLIPVRFEPAARVFRECVDALPRGLPTPIDPLPLVRGPALP